jgi:hypothetical protein
VDAADGDNARFSEERYNNINHLTNSTPPGLTSGYQQPACQRLPSSLGGAPWKSQCVIVDIQIIGRKPHAPTGLNGWVGFKNKAIRERSDLPHHSSLPSIQGR